MTTAPEGGTLTALDLLFGAEADAEAARTLAGEITSPGSNQAFDHALAGLPEATRKAAVQEAATAAAACAARACAAGATHSGCSGRDPGVPGAGCCC